VALSHADAVATLYQSSQEAFVSERKRLATELKASGDKAGAARLAKLGRPTLSAWAVNQLWWRARSLFEELLGSSARLRRGDRSASGAHRDALTALRIRAAALLSEGGHAATDATLRRVTTTLAALAAAGGFEPEPPGALSADRDPPGFEALAGVEAGAEPELDRGVEARVETAVTPEAAASAAAARSAELAAAEERQQARREQQARSEAERQAEARREREDRARRQAEQEAKERRASERQELRVALPAARAQLARDAAAVERLRAELTLAEQSTEKARNALAELEQRQARLDQSESH
jgi:hypothetical protein